MTYATLVSYNTYSLKNEEVVNFNSDEEVKNYIISNSFHKGAICVHGCYKDDNTR
jgi:hypothetical protein